MKKLTLNEFINKSNLIHNNKYDYSLVNYIGNKIKIKIICPIHGEFEQEPRHHTNGRGCNECGRVITNNSRKLTLSEFIDKSNLIHNNKYDYSLVNYTNYSVKVDIICKTHGLFKQTPNNHVSGTGCPKCSSENHGWNYHLWEQQANMSNYFDGFKLYFIKCWDDNETFYKIGKTFNKIDTRFSGEKKLPYNWELIKIIEGTSIEISKLESDLKKNNAKHSYIPIKQFRGMYECFSKLID